MMTKNIQLLTKNQTYIGKKESYKAKPIGNWKTRKTRKEKKSKEKKTNKFFFSPTKQDTVR